MKKLMFFFPHKLSFSILRKLLINLRRYLIFINLWESNLWINFSWIHLIFYPYKSVTMNRNSKLLNQYIFELIHFGVHLIFHHPPPPSKKIDLKEIGHICWSAWRKKNMFLLTLMLSWYLYYLFYDIFVMNDIQSTINNNKTSVFFCTRCFC